MSELLALAVAFREDVTESRLRVYMLALGDLSDEQFGFVVAKAIRELKFPRVSELRQFITENREAESRTAWETALDFSEKWIQSDIHGQYRIEQGCRNTPPPQLDARIARAVVRIGGWRKLKTASPDDLPFIKRDFLTEFQNLSEQPSLATGGGLFGGLLSGGREDDTGRRFP